MIEPHKNTENVGYFVRLYILAVELPNWVQCIYGVGVQLVWFIELYPSQEQ
jgi:hypothetical protein